MDVQVIYSEGDQALLDMAKKTLADYEESLMFRLRKDGMNWAATDQEIHRAFMNDPGRILLSDNVVKAHSVIRPIKTIITYTKQELNVPRTRSDW